MKKTRQNPGKSNIIDQGPRAIVPFSLSKEAIKEGHLLLLKCLSPREKAWSERVLRVMEARKLMCKVGYVGRERAVDLHLTVEGIMNNEVAQKDFVEVHWVGQTIAEVPNGGSWKQLTWYSANLGPTKCYNACTLRHIPPFVLGHHVVR